MAAECSSADTGLGPSMARESQNENGSCAALPSAATSTPAATTSSQPGLVVVSASRLRSVPPASAAATAT